MVLKFYIRLPYIGCDLLYMITLCRITLYTHEEGKLKNTFGQNKRFYNVYSMFSFIQYIYIVLSRINRTAMNLLLKVSRSFDDLHDPEDRERNVKL